MNRKAWIASLLVPAAALLAAAGYAPKEAETERAPAPARADRGYPRPGDAPAGADVFRAIDKDGDGMISRAEAQSSPSVHASFDELDTNRDGKLTPRELQGLSGMMSPAGTQGARGASEQK
ncbi:MAG TPA: hypothetical protein VLW45_03040 [Pelomicrobium sp.]|nr:hypothetical protein [Pelomicrobium sp.]